MRMSENSEDGNGLHSWANTKNFLSWHFFQSFLAIDKPKVAKIGRIEVRIRDE